METSLSDPGTPSRRGAANRPPKERMRARSARFLRRQWRPILLIGFILLVLSIFRRVLTPFVISFALAYVLLPPVHRLSRFQIRGKHLPLWTSILVVYAFLIGSGLLLLSVTAPAVLVQLQKLIDNVPVYADQADRAQDRLVKRLEIVLSGWERKGSELPAEPQPTTQAADSQPVTARDAPDVSGLAPRAPDVTRAVEQVTARVRSESLERLKRVGAQLPNVLVALVEYIFGFFLILMLTFMFIVYLPMLSRFVLRLVPLEYHDEFQAVAAEINLRLGGVVRGQLLICLINGLLTYLGLRLIGVNFPSLLAFVAGVLSLIPIFGAIISTVPAVLIGLTQSLGIALLVLGWIVVIHMLEAYVLNPKIMGDSAHMNPLLIVFALLVGSHYFHPVLGPLLAAPIAAITQTVFLHFLTREDRTATAEVPVGNPVGGP